MKLCVPIPCFYKNEDFLLGLKTAAELGYEAAETYDWKTLDPVQVRDTCRACGIRLISMCTTEFRMTDPQYRDLWLRGLADSCRAAVTLGADKLITQVGPDTGAERARQHEAIVQTLSLAKPILEDSGVTVMIEPLNVLVDHPGYYLTSAQESFDIVREVNNPFVKVVYDVYHQQITEGNIIPSVTRNLDCIAHLHAAGHPGRIDLQFGETDYRNVFAAIIQAGYTGYCGLEYHPVTAPADSLKKAMALYGK